MKDDTETIFVFILVLIFLLSVSFAVGYGIYLLFSNWNIDMPSNHDMAERQIPYCTIELNNTYYSVEFEGNSRQKALVEVFSERGWSNIRIDRNGDDSVVAECIIY